MSSLSSVVNRVRASIVESRSASAVHKVCAIIHAEEMSGDRLYFIGPNRLESFGRFGPWRKMPNLEQVTDRLRRQLQVKSVGSIFDHYLLQPRSFQVDGKAVHLHGVCIRVRGYNPAVFGSRRNRKVEAPTPEVVTEYFNSVVPRI